MQPFELSRIGGPHEGQPVITEGPDPAKAACALILVHGRGAGAQDILGLGREVTGALGRRDLLLFAPHAMRSTWYPNRFMEPEETNQPWLDSARQGLEFLLRYVTDRGMSPEKIFLLGFSQGACLVSDVAARNPRRYGGLFILSGGLIGPAGTRFAYSGEMEGTPVLIGCSDVDPHIPVERVRETSRVLESLGARVDERIYPGMGHTVNADELGAIVEVISVALTSPNPRPLPARDPAPDS
ncbi:MAG: phospholipase [Spirochaetaceae bacterium]|nr:MAG: phospholipase [Spirochaetaceae bacterium]